ncbi:UPF0193 protein EVG1 [Aplochiton taeniatus]
MESSTQGKAAGGLWNCPRTTHYSKDTQAMLKLMMQESRLTNFQQRQINDRMKKGAALPLTCNPTSSSPPSQPKSKAVQHGQTCLSSKPQRRSADACSSGENYTREMFRPSATRDLEKEKRRLQNILATGQEEPNSQKPKVPLKLSRQEEVERDRFQEVLEEIEQRRQFLEEMTALGKGKNYQTLINTEISQKIRELEVIDKARSTDLRAQIMSEKMEPTTKETASAD